jgi:hypothetical protein
MSGTRTIVERLRDTINEAMTTGACLTLRQIASLSEVNYDRLWRFTNHKQDSIPLYEVERIHLALTGRDLFQA